MARLVLGIGCERGTDEGLLERGIEKVLAEHALPASAVCALATLESKHDEAGLLALAQRRGWPLTFYSVHQLAAVSVQGSELVSRSVGTPAVAEPAARLRAGRHELTVPKTIHREPGVSGSMTIAIATESEGSHG